MSSNSNICQELKNPIIFIGNPRSGTSVISEIVMRHSSIGYASQFQNRYPTNLNLNYLRILTNNKLWRIHGQKRQLNKVGLINKLVFKTSENYHMWDEITGPDIDFSRGFLLDTQANDDRVDSIRKYFKAIVKKQGKKRLAFKITGPSRIEFLHSIFPDAQFVRIHRKPIPTISSLLKSTFWNDIGAEQLWWTGPYSEAEKEWAETHKKDPVAMTAFQIKKVADVTDYEVARTKANVLDVMYADFVQNPEDTIKNILNFVGLKNNKECLAYFKKNKIYNRNKKDEDYFGDKDLETIRVIHSKASSLEMPKI